MAQERHVSPEKQLLGLIEGSDAKGAQGKVYTAKRHGLSFVSPAAWKSRFSFLKHQISKSFKGGGFHQFDVKLINRVLGLGVFFFAAYFIGNIYFSMLDLEKEPNIEVKLQPETKVQGLSGSLASKEMVAYYLEKLQNRSIFKMGPKQEEEEEIVEEKVKGPSSDIIEATQNLKLVGISWSDSPDVMIEDTAANRTFFVKSGDYIGDVKIEAVFRDKVVLNYKGEELELQ